MASTTKTRIEEEITLAIPRFVASLSIDEAVHKEQLRLHRFHLDLYPDQRIFIRVETLRVQKVQWLCYACSCMW